MLSSIPSAPQPDTPPVVSAQSFYMRPLPTQLCTPFQSAEGRGMFSAALAQGTMECFFPLIEQVRHGVMQSGV